MARNIDDIQRDIERTRRQLASTLDELADRSKPANLANDAKAAATEKLSQQNVQIALASDAALVVGAIAFSVVRSRRKSNDLKELQRLLSEREFFAQSTGAHIVGARLLAICEACKIPRTPHIATTH